MTGEFTIVDLRFTIFVCFGGASVLASRLVSSLAPPVIF